MKMTYPPQALDRPFPPSWGKRATDDSVGTSLLKTREATDVIISCPCCSAAQPLSSQHQSQPTVPNWKHFENGRLVEQNLVGNQSLFFCEDSHWLLKVPWEVPNQVLDGQPSAHRTQRKSAHRTQRKDATTDRSAPQRGKNGDQKRKRGKDRSKRKNKNNTSTKDACKYCKKSIWSHLRKCWSLLANAKERPNKGKWKQ